MTINQFKKTTNLGPINTLLSIFLLEVKKKGLWSAYSEKERYNSTGLNYGTILKALKFRKQANGLFELDLKNIEPKELLERVTGADAQKIHTYEAIRDLFSALLDPHFNTFIKREGEKGRKASSSYEFFPLKKR